MCAKSRAVICALSAVCVVMASARVRAQNDGVVRGRIVAQADGSALPGAEVSIAASTTGHVLRTRADASGEFVFAGVRAGLYVLAGSLDGFRTAEVPLELEPREIRTVTLSLPVAGVEVTVDVTAGAARASTHSPSSTLLTPERLDTLPAFQRTNLPDAVVASSPGMIRSHDDFVHIRGHEIALNPLIDGVAFWENTHGALSAGLSPMVIETANVMTGGFPAEYGNRFGGVVDIVTKSGFDSDGGGAVEASVGGAGRRRVDGALGGARGDFGYYVAGSAFGTDRYFSPPDRYAFHDSATGGHLFVALDRRSDRAGAIKAVVMADAIDAGIPRRAADVELRPLANADQRTRQQTAIVGWTQSSSKALVNASVYERWSQLRLLPADGPLTARAQLTRELLTLGAKADVTGVFGRHTLKAGADAVRVRPAETLSYSYEGYRQLTHLLDLPHLHFASDPLTFAGRESGGQISAYVQDRIDLAARVTADVGLRVDRYGLVVSDTHWSPRVNLAWHAAPAAVLHASYNHFFVPPAIEGVLSSSAGLTASIREIGAALPPLRPTIEDQFEAGGSLQWGPWRVAATGYYRESDNPVHTTVWPDARIYSYASFHRARAYGLETKVDVSALAQYGVIGYANYALGRVDFSNPVTGGFVTEGDHLTAADRFPAPMDQRHTATGGLTYRHAASGLSAGAAIEYGSGTPIGHGASHEHAPGESDHEVAPSAGAARVPGHASGSVSLGIDLLRGRGRPRITLRLDVENVTNHVYVIARESQFSPSQYSNPRIVSVTVRYRF